MKERPIRYLSNILSPIHFMMVPYSLQNFISSLQIPVLMVVELMVWLLLKVPELFSSLRPYRFRAYTC
jgi:uncharacterized membrane protein